ncbi:MAG: alanine--tRNA ligase-related protein [Spirochaetaceae bacterium]
MTQQLYYEDPHRTRFEARVLSTEPAASSAPNGAVWVELDRTCFYPEGGGQPADRGYLEGRRVLDVQKRDGRILHLVDAPPETERIEGRVDEAARRDYMQQHTGQHIISASMLRIGGHETVSVHQGADYTTVEFASAEIPDADLEEAEEAANAVVCENRPVTTFQAHSSEAEALGLRRPPTFEGEIRVVEIDGFDRVACGGVHCTRTGEVGFIKLVGTERIRGNVRTIWKIGDRALADYRLKTVVCNKLVDTFSAKLHELPERAAKLEENLKEAQWEAGRLQKRLAEEIAERLVGDTPGGGNSSAGNSGGGTPGGGTPGGEAAPAAERVLTKRFSGEEKALFRAVAEELAEHPGVAALLINEVDGRVQWIIVTAEGVEIDFSRVREELLPLVQGKGGGKPPVFQGVGDNPDGAEDLAAAFRMLFAQDSGRDA